MTAVIMNAKMGGKCRKCGGRIIKGSMIYWERGRGAWHLTCGRAHP